MSAPNPSPIPAPPASFRSPAFLKAHLAATMAFYDRAETVDASGGLYHFYLDDGEVLIRQRRHLVNSTRFVYTYAMASRFLAKPADPAADYLAITKHALAFLSQGHLQADGGYAWLLDWRSDSGRAKIVDATNHCYGLAFVVLAHAHALMAGIAEAAEGLDRVWQLMEDKLWEPAFQLYADTSVGWTVGAYRGQNAVMHACEANMAAYKATSNLKYLHRATALADAVTGTLTQQTGSALPNVHPECAHLVWEHYGEGWKLDPNYSFGDFVNDFRPWGFQVGHQTEWTKLLIQLERLRSAAGLPPEPNSGRIQRAKKLFDTAMKFGWDSEYGGLIYGFTPEGKVYVRSKFHWVQAESIGAAALLALEFEKQGQADVAAEYWSWYDKLWHYVWQHFVDHTHGAWYRILMANNSKVTDEKSPIGKVDYHNMGICYDILDAMGQL